MGYRTFDQYSLLHLASGIVAYFLGLNIVTWFIIHLAFEILENTETGMHIINKYFLFWPGGKPYADSFMNSIVGDQLSAVAGWYLAYFIDKYGKKYKWYQSSPRESTRQNIYKKSSGK